MIENTETKPTLQSIPWLMDLSPSQLQSLRAISGYRYLNCGDILFREGDNDNLLYIVSEGQLAIEITVPGHGQVNIYNAEALDVVGWDSMTPVARQRITSARAIQNCCVIFLFANALSDLCDKDPALGVMMMRRLSNVITSRMLSMRIKLLDLLIQK